MVSNKWKKIQTNGTGNTNKYFKLNIQMLQVYCTLPIIRLWAIFKYYKFVNRVKGMSAKCLVKCLVNATVKWAFSLPVAVAYSRPHGCWIFWWFLRSTICTFLQTWIVRANVSYSLHQYSVLLNLLGIFLDYLNWNFQCFYFLSDITIIIL
jgi:hypothetical protein